MTLYARWTAAWLVLCIAFALHLYEEAITGSYTTHDLLYQIVPSLPRFHFKVWFFNVAGAVAILFGLTWLVHKRIPTMRFASYGFATFAAANATIHLLQSLAMDRVWPGAITSPLLLLTSLLLFLSIPRSEFFGLPPRG